MRRVCVSNFKVEFTGSKNSEQFLVSPISSKLLRGFFFKLGVWMYVDETVGHAVWISSFMRGQCVMRRV